MTTAKYEECPTPLNLGSEAPPQIDTMKDARENRIRTGLALAGIVVVGLALRCYGIDTRSLWFDEAFSYWLSRYPLGDLLNRVAYDNHPPLHYLLLKGWTAIFGTSLLALRSQGVLFGTLAILGAYLFTVEALRGRGEPSDAAGTPTPQARGTGLWVAALVALGVLQIRSAWDVRMYALGAALTAFSSWALFRALHAPPRRVGFWLLYALLALLFVYTHYIALFTIAAQALFVAGYLLVQARGNILAMVRQPAFHRAAVAGTLIALGWLPWLPTFLHQRHQVGAAFWVGPVNWQSIRGNGYHMLIEPECYVHDDATIVALGCAILCVTVPLALLWKPRAAEWYVIAAALLPIGLSVVASTCFGTRIFYSRYFVFANLLFLASVGLLLGRIRWRWPRRIAGAILLLVFLGIDLRMIEKVDPEKSPGFGAVAAYVESHRQPDQPVVVSDHLLYLPLRYYAGAATGWYQFGEKWESMEKDPFNALSPASMINMKELTAIAHDRVWVIRPTRTSFWPSDVPVPPEWVARTQVETTDAYGVAAGLVVIEYEVVPALGGDK